MKISYKFEKLNKLARKKFWGLPIGIIASLVIAIIITGSFYAAPKILNSQDAALKSNRKQLKTQNDTKISNKSPVEQQTTSSEVPSTNNPQLSKAAVNNSSANEKSTVTGSIQSAPNITNQPIETKPIPTMTGISVYVPGYGQTVEMAIPSCDYETINSGTPEVCHHYTPISFNLVATYSDGSTKPLSWLDANISVPGSLIIPKLFNVDASNNTLIEGDSMGSELGAGAQSVTLPMHIIYQNWSYTEFIYVTSAGFWGQ